MSVVRKPGQSAIQLSSPFPPHPGPGSLSELKAAFREPQFPRGNQVTTNQVTTNPVKGPSEPRKARKSAESLCSFF